MIELVRVEYRKYDGSLHWNGTMRRLGEDEHGVWLGAPRDATMRRGNGPEIPHGCAHVLLFPHRGWWTAAFNTEPRTNEVYCDITTPHQWPSRSQVTMVDLDLDVVRKRGERVTRLLDEDEFAEHQVKYGYPAEVIAAAEDAGRWLMSAVADGTEPFASTYLEWLRLVDDAPGTPGAPDAG